MHACMLSRFSHVQLCVTLWTAATRLLCPQDSPGKNTGVGCHFYLQQEGEPLLTLGCQLRRRPLCDASKSLLRNEEAQPLTGL